MQTKFGRGIRLSPEAKIARLERQIAETKARASMHPALARALSGPDRLEKLGKACKHESARAYLLEAAGKLRAELKRLDWQGIPAPVKVSRKQAEEEATEDMETEEDIEEAV